MASSLWSWLFPRSSPDAVHPRRKPAKLQADKRPTTPISVTGYVRSPNSACSRHLDDLLRCVVPILPATFISNRRDELGTSVTISPAP